MKSGTIGSIFVVLGLAIGAVVLVVSPSIAVEAVYPVERARQSLTGRAWAFVSGLFAGARANVENERLRREVASLRLLKGDNARLAAENDRLRRALSYMARTPGEWLAAGVLSRGGGAAGVHSVLRVDKGSLDGLRRGFVAAVPEGLVGLVTDVTPHTSEVTLVTDPSLKVACSVGSGSVRATGILSGAGDGQLVLRHLRQTRGLLPPARVFTSGSGGVFPPGLEIGTLLEVRKDPGGLVREGEVLPQVDYSALKDVFIRCEK